MELATEGVAQSCRTTQERAVAAVSSELDALVRKKLAARKQVRDRYWQIKAWVRWRDAAIFMKVLSVAEAAWSASTASTAADHRLELEEVKDGCRVAEAAWKASSTSTAAEHQREMEKVKEDCRRKSHLSSQQIADLESETKQLSEQAEFGVLKATELSAALRLSNEAQTAASEELSAAIYEKECAEAELDGSRLKTRQLVQHLGEIQRRLISWGLNPRAFLSE